MDENSTKKVQRKLIKENGSLPKPPTVKSPTFSSRFPLFYSPFKNVLKAFFAQMEKELHKKKTSRRSEGKILWKIVRVVCKEVFDSQGKILQTKLHSKALVIFGGWNILR